VAPPANWEPVSVAGTYVYPDGLPASGTVTFTNSLYLRDPDLNLVIVPKFVQFVLDGTGSFSGTLMATDDPDIDPTFYYKVTENIGGVTTTFDLLVPKDQIGTLQMSDVDRNLTIPDPPEIYTRTINGMYGDVLLPADLDMVPETRAVNTSTGLTGGGNLTVDRTLSVVTDSTVQKGEYAKAGTLIGTRKRLNIIDGSGISTTVTDNSGQNRVDVTIAATGASPGGTVVNETTYGLSPTAGVAATYSRSDHSHGSQVGIPTTSGLLSARPAVGTAGRLYYATDVATLYYDDGVQWDQLDQQPPIPKSWTAAGHSYLQYTAGSHNQRSRLDSIIKNRWGAESTNWINFAIAGSCITKQGASQGGWGTFWREINKLPGKVAPYTNSDGGLLICAGINDLGTMGGATAQMQTAWGHALRSMISRWRASTIKEDTDASVGYTGSWSNGTDIDHASNGTFKFRAGAVTGDVVTITLPADYDGSPVVACWMGRPGTNGGTITFAGTALVGKPENGSTINTNDTMPALSFSHVPVVKRITSLTSANAGQTVTMTVTANLNEVQFDCWWLEAIEAPPVVVCNVARLTATGYSTKYSSWNAAPALGSCDADVAAFNTVLTNVRNEFDGMVQIADIDAALNKTASLFTDGLHPNELGAALCADAIDIARRRMSLTGRQSPTLNFNMGPRYGGGIRRRRVSGGWYTGDHSGLGTAITPVAGDMYAMPFEVTEGDEQYARFCLEVTALTSGSPTIRWGVLSDYMGKGYPDINLQELTFAGAFTITAGAGVKMNPAAQFIWWPDVANYYFWLKFETVGTGLQVAAIQGPSLTMPHGSSTGAITGTAARAVAYKWTGQAAGAFPTTAPTGGVLVNTAPYMAAQKTLVCGGYTESEPGCRVSCTPVDGTATPS
jgi:hypothetical protein